MNSLIRGLSVLFSPVGRIGRLKFFYGIVGAFLLFLFAFTTIGAIAGIYVRILNPFGNLADNTHFLINVIIPQINVYANPIFTFFFIVNILFLLMKRLRDMDCSAWWCVMAFVPVFNVLFYLIVFFVPGVSLNCVNPNINEECKQ